MQIMLDHVSSFLVILKQLPARLSFGLPSIYDDRNQFLKLWSEVCTLIFISSFYIPFFIWIQRRDVVEWLQGQSLTLCKIDLIRIRGEGYSKFEKHNTLKLMKSSILFLSNYSYVQSGRLICWYKSHFDSFGKFRLKVGVSRLSTHLVNTVVNSILLIVLGSVPTHHSSLSKQAKM